MEKTVMDYGIRTYPSKSNRTSRSYRPSTLTLQKHVFDDDNSEDIFDQLVNEEKIKHTLIKENIGDVKCDKTENHKDDVKLSFYQTKRSTTLKNIQNIAVDHSTRRSQFSRSSFKSNYRCTTSLYNGKDKENIQKLSSRLYISDSDSSADQSKKLFDISLDLKKNNDYTVERKQQKRNYDLKSSLRTIRKRKIKKPLNWDKRRNNFRMNKQREIFDAVTASIAQHFYNGEVCELSTAKKVVSKYRANKKTRRNHNTTSVKQIQSQSANISIKKNENTFRSATRNQDSLSKWNDSSRNSELFLCSKSVSSKNNVEKKFNSIIGKLELDNFNPVTVSTPEFDRKSKLRNINSFLSLYSTNNSEIRNHCGVEETPVTPDKHSLLRQDFLNPSFVGENPVTVKSLNGTYEVNLVEEVSFNEEKIKELSYQKSDAKLIETSTSDYKLASVFSDIDLAKNFINDKNTDRSPHIIYSNRNSSSVTKPNFSEILFCEQLKKKSLNKNSFIKEEDSTEIQEDENLVDNRTIVSRLRSKSEPNVMPKKQSFNEEVLISPFRNLSLNLVDSLSVHYSNRQNFRDDTSDENESCCEHLEEQFRVNLSIAEDKLSSAVESNNFHVESSEINQTKNETTAVLENSDAHTNSEYFTNKSSDFSDSNEKFTSVLAEEYLGFISESANTNNSLINKDDVQIFPPKTFNSPRISFGSFEFSPIHCQSDVQKSPWNVTRKSIEGENTSASSGEFAGFVYDSKNDNKKNGKLSILAKMAGIHQSPNESNRAKLQYEKLSKNSSFDESKLNDDENVVNTLNSKDEYLSDTTISQNCYDTNSQLSPERYRSIETFLKSLELSPPDCKSSEIFSSVRPENYAKLEKQEIANREKQLESISEENEKEISEYYPVTSQIKFAPLNSFNFTVRKKKEIRLLTVNEDETENGNEGSCNENFFVDCTSSDLVNKNTSRQSFYLSKGKKWRRSFITLKNIRDFGFNKELLTEENKGRCWKQNIENLISIQEDASIIIQEAENSCVPRGGVDETAAFNLKENSVISQKNCSQRARFSLCVNFDASNKNEITNETVSDNSFTWCINDFRRSFIENFDVQAGDCSKNYSLPLTDYYNPNSAKEVVLHYCKQNQPLPFEECFPGSILHNCKKIGEGVYGEVFMLKKKCKRSVLKIIPIEGDQLVNGEKQKKFDEILSELVIALELSNLKKRSDFYSDCFAEVQQCWCVYGKYPPNLINHWKKYDLEKGSDNDSPKMFKDDQLYIILELNHGGEDLESLTFNNAQQTISVFKQVANALAVAEKAFMFEHRDLHWGNVLISKCKNKETTFVAGDEIRTVKLCGVKVTIIDYTLSRISVKNHTFYNNIGQDPELFTAEGDFQFEVYRLMKEEVKNIWDRFVPKTNVIWLYYLLDKMINEVRYRREFTKIHQQYFKKLQELYMIILNYESSCDLIKNCCIL